MPTDDALVLRVLTPEELPLLHTLWDQSHLEYRPKGRDSIENLTLERNKNPRGFIGAFQGEKLIGFVLASDDGRRGWINRLAVHPDHRGQHVGERLIEDAERVLREQGRQIIAALIEGDNTHSQNLFVRVGYLVMPEVLYFSKRVSWDV